MTPLEAIRGAYELLPHRMNSSAATVLLLAIQLQENPRRLPQQVKGPAVGDYQMELGGGIVGVLRHKASRTWAHAVCLDLDVQSNPEAVYAAIRDGDPRLDAAFARLLLWTDSQPLPTVGDVAGGWECYLRTWRPGAAKRDYDNLRKKWSVNYAAALDIFRNG